MGESPPVSTALCLVLQNGGALPETMKYYTLEGPPPEGDCSAQTGMSVTPISQNMLARSQPILFFI